MVLYRGKYLNKEKQEKRFWFPALISLFLVEVFSFRFLMGSLAESLADYWPLAFGAVWSLMLWSLLGLLPGKISRIGFAAVYLAALVFAVGQTGYFLLFGDMMWLSDFRYASEGADYLDVILSYPAEWYLWILGLITVGTAALLRCPQRRTVPERICLLCIAAFAALWAFALPQMTFEQDDGVQYAGSNYGRSRSVEAAYENMFDAYRLYQICGMYHTAAKDIWAHGIYPLTPAYSEAREAAGEQIDAYFLEDGREHSGNEMTGLLEGKNVILVLMESMDDWMIGQHTPTVCRLMEEGISFTNFYTPAYGGIRTFNTEFCVNTGSFLSGQGGYTLDYATNDYDHSLANLLSERGYSAKMFHYNDPTFYSRDVFSEAMGYEEYVCYADYLTDFTEKERKQLLYEDQLLFDNSALAEEFFRPVENRLNFVITRSAHLSYKYNEVLSYYGIKKYPEYVGLTGSEETDCALVKARLVDDFFARLLEELERRGELENTVIIGVTDHYTYGYKDTQTLLELSGVNHSLLLEKTPCFIWSKGISAVKVEKVLNTSDLLPTVLNLLGVETERTYLGQDAFSERYDGFVPFSDGSWITAEAVYDGTKNRKLTERPAEEAYLKDMCDRAARFVQINNLILQTDYYRSGF